MCFGSRSRLYNKQLFTEEDKDCFNSQKFGVWQRIQMMYMWCVSKVNNILQDWSPFKNNVEATEESYRAADSHELRHAVPTDEELNLNHSIHSSGSGEEHKYSGDDPHNSTHYEVPGPAQDL